VDLLADGRHVRIERAHDMYAAATTNVMPNMNMQMPDTIRAVRTFLRASRRVIIGANNTSCARGDRRLQRISAAVRGGGAGRGAGGGARRR